MERVSSMFVMSFFWLCLCKHMFVVSGLCLHDQQSLLLQLKNNLKFPTFFMSKSGRKLKSWNRSDDCCKWMGVTCDEEGRVIGLDLSGETIYGGIDNSSSLFRLQHLQNLNLANNIFNSVIPYGFNKLENLNYLNLSYSGFVGQIPMEISQLTRLVTLDISSISYLMGQDLKLENPNLEKLVQNLTSIRQLYLDGVTITTWGKEWWNSLLSLPDLQELSMSSCNLSRPLGSSLTKLENLSVIILDDNNLSSPVPETFANFKNLTILSLAYCGLNGKFPQKIFQIGTLSVVDISFNSNLHGSFPDFPISGSLRTLRVSNTSFSGALPYSIGNMRQLSELDLSYCQFNGTLPNSLSNLTALSYVDLSYNNFTGRIPSFGMAKKLSHLHLSRNSFTGPIPSSTNFEGLHNLISIDLGYNSMNGTIPSSLFTLPLLQRIRLSYNQFSQLDEFKIVSSSKLNTLDIASNNLFGPFPSSIFQLNALTILQLSLNKFNGSMQLNSLLKLRNLTTLELSHNNLSIYVSVTNTDQASFPNIISLKLAHCNLRSFPGFLRNQTMLIDLDLSDNQIQGIVPNWIWKLQNLQSLNISHNLLTDLERPLQNLTSNLLVLDLHHNQMQGPIPVFPKYAAYLDYSRNKFSSGIPQDIGNYLYYTIFVSLSNNNFNGSISDSLCSSNLQVLDLSINHFSGTIPPCLMLTTDTLGVLNLQSNNLVGRIPDIIPGSCALNTLNLHRNLLDGPIPKSLAHCSTLEVLDLGANQLIGSFPCFLNKISTLRVLVLRNNNFQGSIGCPEANKTWQMLQIVDIAFNNFSGKLAGKYFTSWDTMMRNGDQIRLEFDHIRFQVLEYSKIYYEDSVTIMSKGQQMELVKIVTAFTIIDFSSNHFEGPIPKELMDFKALYVFNLSNNAFSSEIPSSIGNLKQLESLDLSKNKLHGEIPMQLASLSFLSFLNLSFNHLEGKIPTGTQLQSFQASSFGGNDGLYGPPLTEEPNGKQKVLQPQPSCGKLTCEIDWNFLSVELGLVFGLGIVFFPILFWKPWRVWYWGVVDKVLCCIFPQLYHEHVTRSGQTYTVLRWWH